MLITLEGRVISFKFTHQEKALFPMLITLEGMVISRKFSHV